MFRKRNISQKKVFFLFSEQIQREQIGRSHEALDNRHSDPNKNYVSSPNYGSRNLPWERNPEHSRYPKERIVPSYGDLYGDAPLSVRTFLADFTLFCGILILDFVEY